MSGTDSLYSVAKNFYDLYDSCDTKTKVVRLHIKINWSDENDIKLNERYTVDIQFDSTSKDKFVYNIYYNMHNIMAKFINAHVDVRDNMKNFCINFEAFCMNDYADQKGAFLFKNCILSYKTFDNLTEDMSDFIMNSKIKVAV